MIRSHRATVLCTLLATAFTGCRGAHTSAKPAPAAVRRCLTGIQQALETDDPNQSTRTLHMQCAGIFTAPPCRDAWYRTADTPDAAGLTPLVTACRAAYCPALGSYWFDFCDPNFIETPDSLRATWPRLQEAILIREIGDYAPEVHEGFLRVLIHVGRASQAPLR